MAFYSPDAAMDQRLAALIRRLAAEHGEDPVRGLSITWLRYGASLLPPERDSLDGGSVSQGMPAFPVRGANWQGDRERDPGDLVHLPYLIACERWLQRGLLEEEPELRRALRAMIRQGSHDATSYVVDRLSGTTSGPALAGRAQQAWATQRSLVSSWLVSLGWPELEGCLAAQKTWQEGPYGRERQFFGPALENANRLRSDGLARLLEGVLAGTLISPPACQRMRTLLAVQPPLDGADVALPGTLAALLPVAGPGGWRRLWGKGGGGGRSHALALYGEDDAHDPTLLVVLSERSPGEDPGRLLRAIVAGLSGQEVLAG